MKKSVAKFVVAADGQSMEMFFTHKHIGRETSFGVNSLSELPVPNDIEGTIAEYRELFPEDDVEVVDNRVGQTV